MVHTRVTCYARGAGVFCLTESRVVCSPRGHRGVTCRPATLPTGCDLLAWVNPPSNRFVGRTVRVDRRLLLQATVTRKCPRYPKKWSFRYWGFVPSRDLLPHRSAICGYSDTVLTPLSHDVKLNNVQPRLLNVHIVVRPRSGPSRTEHKRGTECAEPLVINV